ncbi:MAG: GYD domain-containing protein [Acidimicrobiia bacterium]
MPKYLIVASYNTEGIKGVLDKGGVARRDAVSKLITDAGGSLESFHFAFGDEDAYVIVDLPNNETVAAIAMTVAASGAVTCKTVVLLTPEEIDRAAGVAVDYRPPGS